MTIRIRADRRSQRVASPIAIDQAVLRSLDMPWSVNVTRHLWDDCIEWTDDDTGRQVVQSVTGRQWDLVVAVRNAIRDAHDQRPDRRAVRFTHERIPRNGFAIDPEPIDLLATIESQDGPRLSITVSHVPRHRQRY